MKRGEIWWADLGAYRPREQTLVSRVRSLTETEAPEVDLGTDEALGREDTAP